MPGSGLVQHPVILYMKRKETVGRRKCSCYLIWSMVYYGFVAVIVIFVIVVVAGDFGVAFLHRISRTFFFICSCSAIKNKSNFLRFLRK